MHSFRQLMLKVFCLKHGMSLAAECAASVDTTRSGKRELRSHRRGFIRCIQFHAGILCALARALWQRARRSNPQYWNRPYSRRRLLRVDAKYDLLRSGRGSADATCCGRHERCLAVFSWAQRTCMTCTGKLELRPTEQMFRQLAITVLCSIARMWMRSLWPLRIISIAEWCWIA